jgi:hypothetical protein
VSDVADAKVLAAARGATNGDKFNSLWAGGWQKLGYPSK